MLDIFCTFLDRPLSGKTQCFLLTRWHPQTWPCVFLFDLSPPPLCHFQINVLSDPSENAYPVQQAMTVQGENRKKGIRIVGICWEWPRGEQTGPGETAPTLIQGSPVGSAPPARTKRSQHPSHSAFSQTLTNKLLQKPTFILEVVSAVELVTPASE